MDEETTFTNEEKDRINYLYGTQFEDITPEDAELIAKWEGFKAKQEADFQARQQAIREENELRKEQAKAEFDVAMSNLQALQNAALARLELLTNGQA